MALTNILRNLPEVEGPVEKKLSFNVKLKWTLLVIVTFFILSEITLYGMSFNALEQFKAIAVILGTNFGSIISLGIGPIVMASIILQLLVGSKIIEIDTSTAEGKRYFQGIQKLMVFFFIIFEAVIYVMMGGIQAAPGYTLLVIFQLILGGLAIVFMDELVTKWGFGSGVSLFIVAGVAKQIFIQLFQFLGPQGNCLLDFSGTACTGKVLILIQSIIQQNPTQALLALAVIIITALIFLGVVWAQSLKVEIPLTYDRLRGYGIKWPLAFFYASVIPVILTAALVANISLFGGLAENWAGHPTFLGGFDDNGQPRCDDESCGFAFWTSSRNIVDMVIRGSYRNIYLFQGITHILVYMIFSTIFAVFWVKTSGMDASAQAHNIMSSGLQIPGFRKDERILESVLNRYIMPLTIMGGAAIGLLAATADLLGAIVSGTSILLAVMIIYQFYQNIAQQHAVDMHPAMKKFMG
ncbi:MAG: preprotein translocase subunit SecY [Nanoarchaeota archaeon]|nr:preprotein translocase subunit SecY [Nanoarchaeota archaeon]